MRRKLCSVVLAIICFAGTVLPSGCTKETPAPPPATSSLPPFVPPPPIRPAGVPVYTYEIVHVYPHDTNAFTEGLVYLNGQLLESTGLHGRSTLRRVELETGRVLQQTNLPAQYFGEGLAVLDGRAYQLTYQEGRGFVYQLDTFRSNFQFTYAGEGWGMTTDGSSLIMDDGSENIRFMDPVTFKERRRITVTADGAPVTNLNELEMVKGELFANVWKTQDILRLDPQTGKILGVIDCSGLLTPAELENTDVLNGIAYDPAGDRLFVTGKFWPKLFEIKLRPKK